MAVNNELNGSFSLIGQNGNSNYNGNNKLVDQTNEIINIECTFEDILLSSWDFPITT